MAIDPTILLIIMLAARAWDVPAPLIAAVIDVESSFNLHAVGDPDKDGVPRSYGLMMINLDGAGYGYTPDLLLNPAFNVFLGTGYLKSCQGYFPNNLKLALACHRQGPEGAAQNGYGASRSYVENILNLRKKYEEELK